MEAVLDTIEAIIEAQISRPDRLARADDMISNESDLASLAERGSRTARAVLRYE
jgi:dephospho-CoA kinase